MTPYEIRFSQEAERELKQLDSSVGQRIVTRLNRLAEHLDSMKPEALTGKLSGFYKLRIGDYRAVYEMDRQGRAIVV